MTTSERPCGAANAPVTPEQCRIVRVGHGANCSSIGSVVDTLFVGAALGTALLAAVCAAMKSESVTIVGNVKTTNDGTKPPPPPEGRR